MDVQQFTQIMEELNSLKNDHPLFIEMLAGLARLKADHDNFRKELLGNGQPGRIQLIEGDIEDMKTEDIANIKQKQQDLETATSITMWKLGTFSAAAGTILTFCGQWIFKKLIH